MRRIPVVIAVLILSGPAVFALQLRPGWKKTLVSATEESHVRDLGGEIVFRYGGRYGTIVYIPVEIEPQINTLPVPPGVLDDGIFLPGGFIDPYLGVPPSVPDAERIAYASGTKGLYVVALVGAFTPDMLAPLWASGVQYVESVVYNSMFVVATPEQADTLRGLNVVEYVEPYHPFYRYVSPRTVYPLGAYYVEIEVPEPSDPALIDYLHGIAVGDSLRRVAGGEYALGVTGAGFEALHRHPLVVFVVALAIDEHAIPAVGPMLLIVMAVALAAISLRRL